MNSIKEEQQGLLAMSELFTAIWLGEWDAYEGFFNAIPPELRKEFTFHDYYSREKTELWHQNHFTIPGGHFVSPYYSTYQRKGEDDEARMNSLLCLIGMYERAGYYFPLEKEIYPDHIGSITGFIASILREEMNAAERGDEEALKQLGDMQKDAVEKYLLPLIGSMKQGAAEKIKSPFLREYISSFAEFIEKDLI